MALGAKYCWPALLAFGTLLLACSGPETTPGQPLTRDVAPATSTPTVVPTATPTPTPTPIPTPTPTPLPSGESLILRAADRLGQVRSAVVQVEGDGSPIELGSGIRVDKFTATILRPDRMRLKATSSFGSSTLELELIKIGRQLYLLNPFGRTWQPLPQGSSPLESLDPFAAADVFKQASNVTRVGRETRGGADTWLVRADIAPDAVTPLVGVRLGDDVIRAQLWIGVQDALLRLIRLEVKSADVLRSVTLALSDFDQPTTIEPPR